MAVRHRWFLVLFVIAGLAAAAAPAARAEDPDFLAVHGGYWDIYHRDDPAAEFGLEYRSDFKPLFLHPFLGVFGTSDGAVYGYGGLGLDIYLGRRIVLTPNGAVGYFEEGGGKDLGHVVEFRTGLELAWRFDDRSRVGIAMHHLSNASLGDDNPGVENLILVYAVPLR